MNGRDPAIARANAKARFRRGMFLLPSLFTAVNIAAGYFSITETIKSISGNADLHLDWAAIAILFAIPFDALDGRIARMTNTTSEFGKELDSLADAITFGVAPSLLALIWGFHFLPDSINPRLHLHVQQAGAFICFLFLMGGVSRLARFNISADAQPRNPGRPGRKYFVGMPIPAAAGLVAATVHFFYGIPVEDWWWWVAIPWLCLVGLCGFRWSAPGGSGRLRKSTSPAPIHSSCSFSYRSCCTSASATPMSYSLLSPSSTCSPASGREPRIPGPAAVAGDQPRYSTRMHMRLNRIP